MTYLKCKIRLLDYFFISLFFEFPHYLQEFVEKLLFQSTQGQCERRDLQYSRDNLIICDNAFNKKVEGFCFACFEILFNGEKSKGIIEVGS